MDFCCLKIKKMNQKTQYSRMKGASFWRKVRTVLQWVISSKIKNYFWLGVWTVSHAELLIKEQQHPSMFHKNRTDDATLWGLQGARTYLSLQLWCCEPLLCESIILNLERVRSWVKITANYHLRQRLWLKIPPDPRGGPHMAGMKTTWMTTPHTLLPGHVYLQR